MHSLQQKEKKQNVHKMRLTYNYIETMS